MLPIHITEELRKNEGVNEGAVEGAVEGVK
jgi:hypothetical protein